MISCASRRNRAARCVRVTHLTLNADGGRFIGMSKQIEAAIANVDAMVEGYITCQLWAGLDDGHDKCDDSDPCDADRDDPEPHPWDDHYSREDVSDEYVEKVREEFAALVYAHPLAVRMYLNTRGKYESGRSGYYRNELFGHDFYLTREGHGAGFWDRGLGDLGEYLTTVAKHAGAASDLWDNGDGVLR